MCKVFGVDCGHSELLMVVRATAVAQSWVPRSLGPLPPQLGLCLCCAALGVS